MENYEENFYDVIVVGGGPAGLTSAIYLARAKYRVLVLEKEKFGGQITITEEIVNYPGVEQASGSSLTEMMRRQAEHFGAGFLLAEVNGLSLSEDVKTVRTASGEVYRALGIVLAVGASPRKLGFEGEKEFQGRGVAYCATCDGEFFTGREVLVVGGGFAAVEESVFLTKYASKVTMIVREPEFTCAAGVADKVRDHPGIRVYFHTEIKGAYGEKFLERALLWNNETGEEWEYTSEDKKPFGIFVFAGYVPATGWLRGQIGLNEQGYIVTDREQATDVPGVYAAGDVCVKGLRQVVTAVGDGAVAATSLEHYVSNLREHLGMPKADWEGRERAGTKKEDRADDTAENSGAGRGGSQNAFLDNAMRAELVKVFARLQNTVTVAVWVDDSSAGRELEQFARELEGISEKVEISVKRLDGKKTSPQEPKGDFGDLPGIELQTGGQSTGIRYYSVPGGHEFNSFVLAIYNCGGPGQTLDEALKRRIEALDKPHKVQVMATLSCTNCPDVVAGTQRIAALSGQIQAEMYDLAKFPEYKEKYDIMAVPCMVVDGRDLYFGKKSLSEIVEILETA